MKPGDLVQVKSSDFIQEMGGFRLIDGERKWWYATTGMMLEDEVLVMLERDAMTYGYAYDDIGSKDSRDSVHHVLLDTTSKRYYAVRPEQLKIVSKFCT